MTWVILIQLCFWRIGNDCAPGQRLFTHAPRTYASFEACSAATRGELDRLLRWLKVPAAIPSVTCISSDDYPVDSPDEVL